MKIYFLVAIIAFAIAGCRTRAGYDSTSTPSYPPRQSENMAPEPLAPPVNNQSNPP